MPSASASASATTKEKNSGARAPVSELPGCEGTGGNGKARKKRQARGRPPDWAFELLTDFLDERERGLPGCKPFTARAAGARVFEGMVAKDKLTEDQIRGAIAYAFGPNLRAEYALQIHTPADLRQKLDKLRDQYAREKLKAQHGKRGHESIYDYASRL